jgi:hypothetical protein
VGTAYFWMHHFVFPAEVKNVQRPKFQILSNTDEQLTCTHSLEAVLRVLSSFYQVGDVMFIFAGSLSHIYFVLRPRIIHTHT